MACHMQLLQGTLCTLFLLHYFFRNQKKTLIFPGNRHSQNSQFFWVFLCFKTLCIALHNTNVRYIKKGEKHYYFHNTYYSCIVKKGHEVFFALKLHMLKDFPRLIPRSSHIHSPRKSWTWRRRRVELQLDVISKLHSKVARNHFKVLCYCKRHRRGFERRSRHSPIIKPSPSLQAKFRFFIRQSFLYGMSTNRKNCLGQQQA